MKKPKAIRRIASDHSVRSNDDPGWNLRVMTMQFITAKHAAGLAARTIDFYEQQIGGYLAWIRKAGLAPERALTPEAIESFLAEQRGMGMKPATLAARYTALAAWCKFLVQRDLIKESPLAKVDKPRIPKSQAAYVEYGEFRALYSSIKGSDWTSLRDRCILLVLFGSGLRVGELAALTVPDVQAMASSILVRHGKGDKARVVPCLPELAAALSHYLQARPSYVGTELFLGNDGQDGTGGPLSDSGVRQMLRRRCQEAGIRRINPHQFRHGFAIAFLNGGMNMSAVSAAMGHSSVKVTEEVYARWLSGGLNREYHEARERMNLSASGSTAQPAPLPSAFEIRSAKSDAQRPASNKDGGFTTKHTAPVMRRQAARP